MRRKILMTCLACVTAVVIGIQVYAATVLDTNIIGLIKGGIDSIKAIYLQQTDQEIGTLGENWKKDIDNFVINRNNEVNNEIQKFKQSEIQRANEELNAYTQILKQEVNAAASDSVEAAKDEITSKVDASIDTLKQELMKELEKQLKDNFGK